MITVVLWIQNIKFQQFIGRGREERFTSRFGWAETCSFRPCESERGNCQLEWTLIKWNLIRSIIIHHKWNLIRSIIMQRIIEALKVCLDHVFNDLVTIKNSYEISLTLSTVINWHQLLSTLDNSYQFSKTLINCHQLLSTLNNSYQLITTPINSQQLLSTINISDQLLSTPINSYQLLSTVINSFQLSTSSANSH